MKNVSQYIPEKTIIEYARNKQKQPIGVVVATIVTDEKGTKFARLGWSKTRVSPSVSNDRTKWLPGDTFDKQKGIEIAVSRAIDGTEQSVPFTIVSTYENVLNRARLYYKGMEVIVNQIKPQPRRSTLIEAVE